MEGKDFETYVGVINKRIFVSKEGDFTIATFSSENEDLNDTITILGNMYGIKAEERIEISGIWTNHAKFGEQFQVQQWQRPIPKTREQIVDFLSSDFFKGIGKKRANNIVDVLGTSAIEIIHEDGFEAVSDIKGMNDSIKENLVHAIHETFEVQSIVRKLLEYNISADTTLKLYKEYGSNTAEKVISNPYIIMDSNIGYGFQKTDEIARNIGIMPTSTHRIRACVIHTLKEKCNSEGHSYYSFYPLIQESLLKLNHNSEEKDFVTQEDLDDILHFLSSSNKDIVIENDRVYLYHLFMYENKLAESLSDIFKYKKDKNSSEFSMLNFKIKDYQTKNKLILAEKQREAVKKILNENLLVLTGGPGTGKTTGVKAIIDIYKEINPKSKIELCAPTGRASKNLEETTGYKSNTIHRMIGLQQYGELPHYNMHNKMSVDLVVVDEFSMVNLQIAYLMMEAIPRNAKVLFVGDSDQLPAVGAGNVMHEVLDSGIPVVQLDTIFRQAKESQIVTNAHRINKGESLLVDREKDDFYFIEEENIERISEYMVQSAKRFQNLGYKIEDILVLSPMKKGEAGVFSLNERLRNELNPYSDDKKEFTINKRFFRQYDKVLQNVNVPEKDIYNGDIGTIYDIKEKEGKEKVICDFGNGRMVDYEKSELNQLELAYCITIHKSQGGEAPIVITPITTSHYIMLARNLYYTGITRAKERVVLVGSHKAMNVAIQNSKVKSRNSRLAIRIMDKTIDPFEDIFGLSDTENEQISKVR